MLNSVKKSDALCEYEQLRDSASTHKMLNICIAEFLSCIIGFDFNRIDNNWCAVCGGQSVW